MKSEYIQTSEVEDLEIELGSHVLAALSQEELDQLVAEWKSGDWLYFTLPAKRVQIRRDGQPLPFDSPEVLLAKVLAKVPQFEKKAIPVKFMEAVAEVIQEELKPRDKALRRLQKLLADCRAGIKSPGYE